MNLLRCPNGFLRTICLKLSSYFISGLSVGMNVAFFLFEIFLFRLVGMDN